MNQANLSTKKLVIICFDGLSNPQFTSFLKHLPKLSHIIRSSIHSEFDSTPFSQPQPIWAEILTGEPWYLNGCAGFASPATSLNDLQINSEQTLRSPIRLLPHVDKGQCNVVINVPLLLPGGENRVWLADGSLPILASISPSSLAQMEPFKKYKPRTFKSIIHALNDAIPSMRRIIADEIIRLECANKLVESFNWRLFVYRTTIFDQFCHILGFEWQNNLLSHAPNILYFFELLDLYLARLINGNDYVLFSSFSHETCRAIYSLNELFQSEELLQKKSGLDAKRVGAVTLIRSDALATPIPLVAESISYVGDATSCASPSYGTVYVNAKERFYDGVVETYDVATLRTRLQDLIQTTFRARGFFPRIACNPLENDGPDLIIDTDGIELVEVLSSGGFQVSELPFTKHVSNGFICSSLEVPEKVQSIDLVEIVSNKFK